MRTAIARLVAVAIVTATVATSSHADAAGSTRAERDKVRRQRAAAAADIDALRAQDSEVTAALNAMNAEVSAQEQALVASKQAVAAAEQALADARAAETAMKGRIAELQATLRDMAVQEYITGGRLKTQTLDMQTDDLGEQARRVALAKLAVGSATDTADQLESAREDLAVARAAAETASKEAAERRAVVESTLASVTTVRNKQADLATRIDERIESRLSEAAALAGLDAQLSARLAQEQAELARRNAGSRRSSGPTVTSGNVKLRTVRGITVAASIADNLEAMLAAAEADGIVLGGGGYRDPAQQRAVRERNCPNPATSPPSACRPPTARPGHSMHERGLAIDFTYNGSTVRSGSAAFRWLSAHAARYGLYNLPGEPWHWSTNGS